MSQQEQPGPGSHSEQWLALLILEGLEVITKGLRTRLGLKQGCRCGHCGHRF